MGPSFFLLNNCRIIVQMGPGQNQPHTVKLWYISRTVASSSSVQCEMTTDCAKLGDAATKMVVTRVLTELLNHITSLFNTHRLDMDRQKPANGTVPYS